MIKAKKRDLIIRGNATEIAVEIANILHVVVSDSDFIAVKLALTEILDINFDEIEKNFQENFECG